MDNKRKFQNSDREWEFYPAEAEGLASIVGDRYKHGGFCVRRKYEGTWTVSHRGSTLGKKDDRIYMFNDFETLEEALEVVETEIEGRRDPRRRLRITGFINAAAAESPPPAF